MKNIFFRNPMRALTGLSFALAASFLAFTAHGQNPGSVAPPAPTTGINSVDSVYGVIIQVFDILFWLLIVLAGIFIIMAAFSYLTAGGDPEKVKTANQKVIYAAVAVVVAVLAKSIPTIVCSFLVTPGQDCVLD